MRVSQGASKFTLDRIVELDAQVATVARLHHMVTLGRSPVEKKRPLDDSRDCRDLLFVRDKLTLAVCESRHLHYVGQLRDGKHVYQSDASHPPPQRQATMWSFTK